MFGRLGAVIMLVAGLCATSAQAATVTLDSQQGVGVVLRYLTYTAGSGERNTVRLALSATTKELTITDSTAGLTVSDPAGVCRPAGLHTATCDFTDGNLLSGVRALLKDQRDTFSAHLEPGPWASFAVLYVEGGAANDVLEGNDVGTTLDSLHGGLGDDRIAGGAGTSYVGGGQGADDIRGGGGFDTLDDIPYSFTADLDWYLPLVDKPLPIGVKITLDDRPGDGFPLENDNVHSDVEQVYGTDYNDVLIGADGFNRLYGFGGNDRIEGKGGKDSILGGGGIDTISGGAGDDNINSYDTLSDKLTCGEGNDTLNKDAKDTAPSDCEIVASRSDLPPP